MKKFLIATIGIIIIVVIFFAIKKNVQIHSEMLHNPNIMTIKGAVLDEITGQPIKGVFIYSQDDVSKEYSNKNGFFKIELPLPENERAILERNVLLFEKEGYITEIRQSFDMWPEGDLYNVIVKMKKGSGIHQEKILLARSPEIITIDHLGLWRDTLVPSNEALPLSAIITTPNNKKIQVRIANTPKTRELGLSYFKSLPADQGMLFLFDQPGNYAFWMKGMNFPLDIIWLRTISENSFEVVYVAENVDPSSYPSMIDPAGQADAVLEINAGQATVHNLVAKSFVLITR